MIKPFFTNTKDYVITVKNRDEISKLSLFTDEWIIKDLETGVYYNVEKDSTIPIDGIIIIGLAAGNVAVLRKEKEIAMSVFGINNSNTKEINTTRLQKAINYLQGPGTTLYSDISYFEITTENGHILIQDSIKLNFKNNQIKVFPDVCTAVENDVFRISPLTNGCTVEITNCKPIGATSRGFELDGTFNPSLGLASANFIHSFGGTPDIYHNVFVDNVKFDKGTFFNEGILFNGRFGKLTVTNSEIHCAKTNGIGVFGLNKTVVVNNVRFDKCGYSMAETSLNKSYGVGIYFHPHVTARVSNCDFHNMPRALQFSSGSFYEESTWDYEITNTKHQIIEFCTFYKTITEKAIVNSWHYPKGEVNNCIFNNKGNGIHLVAPLSINNCDFNSNLDIGILTSFPSDNRNDTHQYNFNWCNFYSKKIFKGKSDISTSPVRAKIIFDNCIFKSTITGFDLLNVTYVNPISKIDVLVKNSHVKSNLDNNPIILAPFKTDLTFEKCTMEFAGGRFIQIQEDWYGDDKDGSLNFEKCDFTYNGNGTPLWFTVRGVPVSNRMTFDVNFEDCTFPKGTIKTGYNYHHINRNGLFGITLRKKTSPIVNTTDAATNHLPINYNHNTYICKGTNLTNAFIELATPTSESANGISSITDPFLSLKGDLYIMGGLGGVTITGNGNLKTPINTTIAENTIAHFILNKSTHNWELITQL